MPVGNLIVRYIYPDGRLTATITVEDEWKTEVFPSKEAAKAFADRNDLKYEELPDGNSGE